MTQYTSEESKALKSIHQVWRASFNTMTRYQSATDRFKACRDIVSNGSYPGHSVAFSITPSTFFEYKNGMSKTSSYRKYASHANDNGDFDDMGNGDIERQYRYNQKRKRGRL